jgi:hypothetical protein
VKSFSSLIVLVFIGCSCYADDGPFKAERASGRALEPCGTIVFDGTDPREWKDPYGHVVQARLVAVAGALIYVEKGNEFFPYPLAGVSANDRDYVRSLLRSAGHATLFPGASDPDDEAARMVLSEKDWKSKIDAWTKIINAKKRTLGDAMTARNHLRSIRDPNALGVLISSLAKNPLDRAVVRLPNPTVPRDRWGRPDIGAMTSFNLYEAVAHVKSGGIVGKITNDPARTTYVEAIARSNDFKAIETLVKTAVADKSGGVRAAAVWALCNVKNRELVIFEYVKYLKMKEHRDGALAGLFASDLASAARKSDLSYYEINKTLIDLLIVEQPIDVPCYCWKFQCCFFASAGQIGGALHFRGGEFAKRIWVPVPCEMAHDMLVRQSGADYGYDRRNWSEWNKGQNTTTSQTKRDADPRK